jgi:acyl dehydratase
VTHWDLDELESWVGREVTYTAPEPIGRASIRYYALAVGDDNPLYTDADVARAHGYDDVLAPPTWVTETNQYVPRPERDRDGYIGHTWQLPVRGCRLVRGGNRYEFLAPFHPGDVVTATWRIADVTQKDGSSGPMLLVTSEAAYRDQHGTVKAVNRETLIVQPLSSGGPA